MNFSDVTEHAGKVIDAAGVILIVLGAVVATAMFALRLWKRRTFEQSYTSYRRALGRSILLARSARRSGHHSDGGRVAFL
jgi:uncharacterized membrane protein